MDMGMGHSPWTRTSRVPEHQLVGYCQYLYKRNILLTIATLVKAVVAIAMIRKDDNVVSALLQPNRCIDYQPLSATNAQVRVEEDDCAVWSRTGVCL
jgi:hypothetical protein